MGYSHEVGGRRVIYSITTTGTYGSALGKGLGA